MSVSRDVVLDDLRLIKQHLDAWIDDIENPTYMNEHDQVMKVDKAAIPQHITIDDMQTVPRAQFKAELALLAAKLEAIATHV